MNKLLSKTTKKIPLIIMTCVAVLLMILSAVLSATIGVNYAATADDGQTITVQMNAFFYNTKIEEVEKVCEAEFEKQGLKVEYVYSGAMSGDDSELMYMFDDTAEKVSEAKASLAETFEAKTADETDTVFYGATISVTSGSEKLFEEIAWSHIWRAVGAVALFAVLTFVYVALRYKLEMGAAAAINSILSGALTTAILLLTRIPVAPSAIYAIAVASLLSTVFTVFYFNKVRANLKADKAKKEEERADSETLVVESSAHKEILVFTASLGVALVLVGAIATASVRLFAIVALLGLVIATATAIFYVPAVYLPLKKAADKVAAKNVKGYVGAKKKENEATAENAD